MAPETSWIETLLYEDESATLDFKRDQYLFQSGTDEQKSELLKDILAFANAWRRVDALILIGVDDVVGGQGNLVGIRHHLDDAKLQQFVNSKTNRPVQFSYEAHEVRSKQVGVIRIPVQPRPLYLQEDYGKLVADTVYIRRGSSTAVATPDEVAEMGREQAKGSGTFPILDLEFGDPSTRERLGTVVGARTERITLPDMKDIPLYGNRSTRFGNFDFSSFGTNTGFYRDVAVYIRDRRYLADLCFALTNRGVRLASDVHVEMTVKAGAGEVILVDEHKRPKVPKQTTDGLFLPHMPINPDSTVERIGNDWLIKVNIPKIKPKQTVWTESPVFIGVDSTTTLDITATIYADEIAEPETVELKVEVEVGERNMSVKDILDAVRSSDK